jgi:hypothetical protein
VAGIELHSLQGVNYKYVCFALRFVTEVGVSVGEEILCVLKSAGLIEYLSLDFMSG